MRLRAILFAGIALAGTGALAWQVGQRATHYVERSSAAAVIDALGAAGQDWASVRTDGLQVVLAGIAPDEASRFRAVSVTRQVIDPRRLRDATEVRASDPLAPPPFAIEFLRNEGEVSLIGLAPAPDAREAIERALARAKLDQDVTDMLETTGQAAPDSFARNLDFALQVLAELPRARVSATPEKVVVTSVAEDPDARQALITRLQHDAPNGTILELDISAPRQVIAPFRLDFTLDQGKSALAACAAETREIADAIRAAAGLAEADCTLGLGAPTRDWQTAAERGIAAVRALGGGRFALTDNEAILTAPPDAAEAALATAAADLRAALPAGYVLAVAAPAAPEAAGAEPPQFAATLAADGRLQLAGSVSDPTSQQAIESFAAALFGHGQVADATVVDKSLPQGWPVRVLAGIEALAAIKEGRVEVTPDKVAVTGSTLQADGAKAVEAVLAAKGAGPAEVAVSYDAAAAAEAAAAARPAPEICAEQVAAILDSQTIGFTAGSAQIDAASQGIIAAIADVLRSCPGASFDIAGHTDSSGAAEANKRLSQQRADAVVAALEASDLPLVELRAAGYGPDRPRADNATPEGRMRNRRIEITLRDPAAVAADSAEPAMTEPSNDAPVADVEVAPPETAAGSPADAAAGTTCAKAASDLLSGEAIVFDLGSAAIAPESEDLVTRLAGLLRGCPGARFEVAGHTDDRGSEAGNQRLSEERAEAVMAALSAADVTGVSLIAQGYGESRPVADNGTSQGRASNRRIEITVAPAPDPGADSAPAAPRADDAATTVGSGDE